MRRVIVKSVLFAVIVGAVSARPAMAGYIDPNTGGLLFQMLAVLFGLISGFVLFFASQIKMTAARFMRFIREKKGMQGAMKKSEE